ncbi:uncharacterized protein ACRADG_004473 isoform 2-T4 [Cochliomyia hominivorax]
MKKKAMKKSKRPKKQKLESNHHEEDKLMEALNSSISIYETHIKNEQSEEEQIENASQDEGSYEQFHEVDPAAIEDSSFYENNCQQTLHETPATEENENLELTLASVQKQLELQNILMEQLLKVSTNMALIMERHHKAEEKKTSIMERQLKLIEYQNLCLRRQETKRKIISKIS